MNPQSPQNRSGSVAIEVEDLLFERWFVPVFDSLSFQLHGGETLVVRGANGSGKTTLLRLLAGILEPTSGSIRRQASAIAWLGHKLGIKDALSVRENLRFMAAFYGQPLDPGHLEDIAAKLQLTRVIDQDAGSLSAGQRKRCALGRLLFQPQALWLLDEPYSNLDQQGMQVVDGLLESHQQRGGCCVLATHGKLSPQGLETRELTVTGYAEGGSG